MRVIFVAMIAIAAVSSASAVVRSAHHLTLPTSPMPPVNVP
jgi:hypothetical protein